MMKTALCNKTDQLIRIIILVVVLMLIISTDLRALEAPVLKGRVNDYANMISPQTEKALNDTLSYVERKDSTGIVVLTIPSLEGDNLEHFSI